MTILAFFGGALIGFFLGWGLAQVFPNGAFARDALPPLPPPVWQSNTISLPPISLCLECSVLTIGGIPMEPIRDLCPRCLKRHADAAMRKEQMEAND